MRVNFSGDQCVKNITCATIYNFSQYMNKNKITFLLQSLPWLKFLRYSILFYQNVFLLFVSKCPATLNVSYAR